MSCKYKQVMKNKLNFKMMTNLIRKDSLPGTKTANVNF